MKSRLGATFFALLFAVPFGGVGVFASWMIGSMVRDHLASGDWVLVQANVEEAELVASRGSKGGTSYAAKGTYRYSIGGRDYTSTRLGLDRLGGSDNVGDWQEEMAAFLKDAKEAGRTIPVFVNPEQPGDAMVDRDLRWGWIAFMALFAIAFGGVGLGALYMIGLTWLTREPFDKVRPSTGSRARAASTGSKAATDPIRSDSGHLGLLWFFTVIWNGVSIPAALLAVPQMWHTGEWMLLLVLLFPLVGALLLWGALAQTLGRLKRGRGTLTLLQAPRMGDTLQGGIEFPRGTQVGETFMLKVLCSRTVRTPGRSVTGESWSFETETVAAAGPRAPRIPVRFDIPADVDDVPLEANAEVEDQWRIEAKPASGPVTFGFDIPMEAAPASARKPRFLTDEPELAFAPVGEPAFAGATAAAAVVSSAISTRVAPSAHSARDSAAAPPSPAIAELEKLFGKIPAGPLSARQRDMLSRITPEQKAAAAQVAVWAPRVVKIIVAIVVLQIVGGIAFAVIAMFNE